MDNLTEFMGKEVKDFGESCQGNFCLVFNDLSYLKFHNRPFEKGKLKVME